MEKNCGIHRNKTIRERPVEAENGGYSTGSMTGSGRALIRFLMNSNEEKNIVLMTQERAIETPRPGRRELACIIGVESQGQYPPRY